MFITRCRTSKFCEPRTGGVLGSTEMLISTGSGYARYHRPENALSPSVVNGEHEAFLVKELSPALVLFKTRQLTNATRRKTS